MVDETLVEAYRAFGAPEQAIEGLRREMRPQVDFEMDESIRKSVLVFQDMDTQWDRAGMDGSRVGLKFQVAPIFMRMHEVKPEDEVQVLNDLKVMEREQLVIDREVSE